MADYDYVDKTTGADYFGQGVLSTHTSKHFVWKRTVDFATAGDVFISDGKFTSSDVLYIFNVVEGMLINYVAVEVTTAEGTTCTIDIGDDGADPNGFLLTVNLEVAGWYQPDTTYAGKYFGDDTPTHWLGKLYTAADEIVIDFGHDTENAVADFWIAGTYFSPIYVA